MQGEPDHHAGGHSRIRVLIADDSATFLCTIKLFLEQLPQVEVIGAATDGEHALALLASTQPDLVLMDLQMPRLNGLLATRKIRAQSPGVSIILLTLHDSSAWKTASLAAGADRFMPKRRLHHELPEVLGQLFPGRNGGAGQAAGPPPAVPVGVNA